jgi:deazaflavin-dependent oxidoreductase (nitroreductase family)
MFRMMERPTQHNGTRGRRQPGTGGSVGRWLTKRAINRIRRKGKMPGLGFNALVLTTIGRKSGLERQTPVGWFPGPDGSWLIVASAAGAARNPAWYYNLAAHPDQVCFAAYQQATDRELDAAEPKCRKRAFNWTSNEVESGHGPWRLCGSSQASVAARSGRAARRAKIDRASTSRVRPLG